MSTILGWAFDLAMYGRWRAFRAGCGDPASAQAESLRRILANNLETRFGRDHDFASLGKLSIRDIWRAFRRNVPIRSYVEFADAIETMKGGAENILVPGRPAMFSLTSGTTSEPKFCPVTRGFIRELHNQHLLWMYNAYKDHPAVNSGKYLTVVSPAEMGRTAGGIPYGAMSGKQVASQSIPVRRRMAVPPEAQSLKSADDRWTATLLFALAAENLTAVTSVNPSTLVALAERMDRDAEMLLEHLEKGRLDVGGAADREQAARLERIFRPAPERARRLREAWRAEGRLTPALAWPGLVTLYTWQGGSAAFYLPRVRELWGGASQRCLGLRASEGNFSIPLRDGDASGVLGVGGHAMEFVPASVENPGSWAETLLAHELETGGLYRLIVTTSGGFYRYDLGDLVEVTGRCGQVPEVRFVRRAGSVLSLTGEKVTEDQVVAAMRAVGDSGTPLAGFTVTWEMDETGARYVLAVELGGEAAASGDAGALRTRLRALLARFEQALQAENCEYAAKRDDGRLAPPRLLLLASGTYARFRADAAARGRPENQVKTPHLVVPPGSGKAPVAGTPFLAAAGVEFAVELGEKT